MFSDDPEIRVFMMYYYNYRKLEFVARDRVISNLSKCLSYSNFVFSCICSFYNYLAIVLGSSGISTLKSLSHKLLISVHADVIY